MTTVSFKGKKYRIVGKLPAVGTLAPSFTLVARDLQEVALESYRGAAVILSTFPSLDTSVCANVAKQFTAAAKQHPHAPLLQISMDLPFAMERFCQSAQIDNAITLSAFRSSFGHDYGLMIEEGPLKGLLARSILVLDAQGYVLHSELVAEITEEPRYLEALQLV